MLCLKIYNPYKLRLARLPLNKNCGSREQIKNHIPPISQKSDVDVDIHDIPAFLRKPK
jgi:hypothetical protein